MLPVAHQLNGAASEAELYQYVMQSFQDFEHTVASKVVHSTAGDPSDSQVLAGAMVSAWAKIDFEPLEEVVDRWVRDNICSWLDRCFSRVM